MYVVDIKVDVLCLVLCLRSIFSRLNYPWSLIDSVISNFDSRKPAKIAERNADESNIVRINLPFKDQVSAKSVRRQLRDLSLCSQFL